ncbi:hypothetical protein StrepF001_04975 [Streptomyces sp. F001]|nr:hypothetical protein StrepF001_04975 [Streptomyces sp. F001]
MLPPVIPEFEDEHASLLGVERTSQSGSWRRRTSDGADSLVDTSIRRRPYDDAEVTEVQVQV